MRDNQAMKLFLLFAGFLFLAGCGDIEWPPPGYGGPGPRDINTPPPTKTSSAAFLGAGAVIAGPGDTVFALSRRHRVPVRAIIEANNLRPPYHLKKGQRVALPRGRQHVVSRGETLYGIARRYDANPYALARANGLKPPYAIQTGQKLVLADQPSLPTQATSAPSAQKTSPPVRSAAAPKTIPRTSRPTPRAVPRPPAVTGKGFVWPVRGRVVSGFGAKAKGLRNDGINIAAVRGASVMAAENGVVAYAGNELRGFGNLLLIKHSNGWVTAYAHTDKVLVKRGDRVRKGQKVATVGSTGNVKNPQLHFEMRRGRRALDPRKHLMGV
ncbi:MAG: M23 family metallopeptidase [Rhodospirillales bacterium]|nr:M23 family metallopeptidase [Rhodospirillales bacterium]